MYDLMGCDDCAYMSRLVQGSEILLVVEECIWFLGMIDCLSCILGWNGDTDMTCVELNCAYDIV